MEQRPLTLLNTRAEHQLAPLRTALEAEGWNCIDLPLIRLAALPADIPELKETDWLVFTSVNSVRFWKEAAAAGLMKAKIACVGSKTAAYAENQGYSVSLIPQEFRAEALADKLLAETEPGDRIIYPRSKKSRPFLKEQLLAEGRTVKDVVLYDTLPNDAAGIKLPEALQDVDIVIFMSPTAVDAFFTFVKAEDVPENVSYGCIGSVTAEALGKKTSREVLVPQTYTIEALIDTIKNRKVKR
ncbi:uroporphyrinogen-III synthase [Alkalicoccus halolimnae]|uniref:Uroporphyrinogen-III synthase n=1 Tax=Alkalicoccus halolimnae TaxID=1667239 RepID=A0A5C7F577_9BACI|nr:uroporphyrinogen-III synthase [Alkalicoccus halolimnae]TXF85811.1 uroporphyrinogen-III synthase [Alkalicoccus halolimnae]